MINEFMKAISLIFMIFSPGLSIFLIIIFLEKLKNRKKVINMSSEKQMKIMSDLQKLLDHAKSLDLEKYHKERIIDEIETRTRIIKNDIIESLGKESFDKLLKEK